MRSAHYAYASTLWLLTLAFALRVAGQAIQRWLPQSGLPPFEAWQGSATPYPVLLLLQLLILGVMVRTAWRVGRGSSLPTQRMGRRLAWIGAIYMAGSIARILIGLSVPSAPAWFSAHISAAFHVVLAAFVLTAALFHLRPAAAAASAASK